MHIPTQPAVSRALERAIQADAIAHAYLFTGPDEIGKLDAAFEVALALNCPEKGCRSCEVCRSILGERHPGFRFFAPQGPEIRVDDVAEISKQAFLKPHAQGAANVVVISEAHRFSTASANKFLKVLEEPPSRVVFLLLAPSREGVPETIASRCVELRFRAVPLERMEQLLAPFGLDEERKRLLVGLACGDVAKALDYAREPDATLRRRDAVLDAFETALVSPLSHALEKSSLLVREFLESSIQIKGPSDETRETARAFSLSPAHERQLLLAERARAARSRRKEARDRAHELTDLFLLVLLDIVYFHLGLREELVNFDKVDRISQLARLVSLEKSLAFLERLKKVRMMINLNISQMTYVDYLLLGIRGMI